MSSEEKLIEIRSMAYEDDIAETIAENSDDPVKFVLLLDDLLGSWDFTYSLVLSLLNRILSDMKKEESRINSDILRISFESLQVHACDEQVLKEFKSLGVRIKQLQRVIGTIKKIGELEGVYESDN